MKTAMKSLLLLAAMAGTPGAMAEEAPGTDGVALTPTANANEWEFSMPAAKVQLVAEYWPQAALTTAPTGQTGLVYTGQDQTLVNADGVASGGTIHYALGTDATTAPTEGWSDSRPQAKNAGTYYVWYKVVGDAEHSDLQQAPVKLTVTIGAKDISDNAVTVAPIADQTYSGSALEPDPVVKDGEVDLVKGEDKDYTVSYDKNTNVTTPTSLAEVTITGKGNYQGTKTANFTIVPKSVESLTVTLNPAGYEYDGQAKQPAVTVKNGDITLVQGEDKDYTVSYENNTNVGTAKVTIAGHGNYTGSKEVTFPIWEPTYQVSSSTDGNGTVSLSPAWAENGQTVTVSATPKEGYVVDQILVNGKPISGNTFTYNQGDAVTVTFRLKQEPAPIVDEEKTIVDENGNRYTVKVTEVETNPETGEVVNDVIVTSVPEDVLNGKKEMQPTIINYAGNDYEVKTVAAEAFDKKPEGVIIFLPEAAKTTAPVENVVNGDGTVEVLNLTPVTKFDAPREVKAGRVVYLRDVTAEITTICLPYDAPIPAGWTVYDLAHDKDGQAEFNLWGRPRLEANHPFLLKYKVTAGARSSRDAAALTATAETLDFSADNATIEATEELEPVIGDDFKLYGTLDDMTHKEGYDLKAYTLQPDGSWKMSASSAYWQRDNVYLKAFNAYLLKSVYTGTSIGTSLDDTTTGISTVEAQTTATDGAWFTLDGKRLDGKPARKGIYVKDGKKVVVK